MARTLAVQAADLLRRPGTERSLSLAATAPELDVVDDRLVPDAEVAIELRLESLTDGIVVDGRLSAPRRGVCRRCLAPIGGVLETEVHELFQLDVVDPDASPIVGDVLDLAPVVREILLVELPAGTTCRPDCAGLCPVCGIDRNISTCRCDTPGGDDRWSVLDQLKDIVGDG